MTENTSGHRRLSAGLRRESFTNTPIKTGEFNARHSQEVMNNIVIAICNLFAIDYLKARLGRNTHRNGCLLMQ